MSDEEADTAFRLIRWADTTGEPVCPHCGSLDNYTYKARKVFRCKACKRQFSVTSGTIFASRKLPVRDYLLAIAIFVNGAKGHSVRALLENERLLGVRKLRCLHGSPLLPAGKSAPKTLTKNGPILRPQINLCAFIATSD